jgi:hypothetical protein
VRLYVRIVVQTARRILGRSAREVSALARGGDA